MKAMTRREKISGKANQSKVSRAGKRKKDREKVRRNQEVGWYTISATVIKSYRVQSYQII